MLKAKKIKKQKTVKRKKSETELFRLNEKLISQENQSLEQPSPYLVVQTFTTYGAYPRWPLKTGQSWPPENRPH